MPTADLSLQTPKGQEATAVGQGNCPIHYFCPFVEVVSSKLAATKNYCTFFVFARKHRLLFEHLTSQHFLENHFQGLNYPDLGSHKRSYFDDPTMLADM